MVDIALNKQVHIYSVDTSMFYDKKEDELHNRLNELYILNANIKSDANYDKSLITKNNKEISSIKKELKKLFKCNKHIRTLNGSKLRDSDKISIFDSALTRAMVIKENEFTDNIVIVRIFYFEILDDLIDSGFIFNNEKYVVLTASAGQIRTKKVVFIKEKVLKEIYNNITCGLTIDMINNQGGVNINKYLAYLALCTSATEEWKDFDIDKTIVVDDMDTTVRGLVDYIDYVTYVAERKEMDVPITHTDGCGLILPSLCKKSRMVRLPWMKGLLVPFPFDKFIKSHNANHIVTDIYGAKHNIIKEDIQVIFTKSQFKMWKFYKDWNQYQSSFKEFGSKANYCNEEKDQFDNAKLNYQMLQTLTDITDEELEILVKKTSDNIKSIGTDKKSMLSTLGVTPFNSEKNHLQQALQIYPELLNDTHIKDMLKQAKKSMVKRAKSGKIELDNSKYTFLVPDLYAFCERLFLNKETPNGLLENKQVSCKLFKDGIKLDCLRSPHLYREHAIRKNIVNEKTKEWFITNGIYTSIHDLISKLLMCDNDGDTSLVCANKTLVEVAERNMQKIVPLYYEMKKAEDTLVTNKNIYKGLTTAFTGGNIGVISNNISKIWNSENPNIDAVKLLCLENNFIIDYAKTLFKPTRTDEAKELIESYTKLKLPYFFIHAKDKTDNQVDKKNNSTVNRLDSLIPNPRLNFKSTDLGKLDYRLLMHNPLIEVEIDSDIIKEYEKLNRNKRFLYKNLRHKRYVTGDDVYINQYIRDEVLKVNSDIDCVVDTLIWYLYFLKPNCKRTTLWSSFGDVIVKNLNNNIKKPLYSGWIMCEVCGKRIEGYNTRKYCDNCARQVKLENDRKIQRKRYINSRKMKTPTSD